MFVPRWEAGSATGDVVVVDVIRAFTTAAYAFGAGAREIYLVAEVEEALAFVAAHPGSIAMGEVRGRRPDGFALSNSPVMAAAADLDGRTVVQRTSAGTQGVFAAPHADRLWCASLVCASATAAALGPSATPTYIITGCFPDRPDDSGEDDRATAEAVERARTGQDIRADEVARFVLSTKEAQRTLALGPEHCHPEDIAYCVDVDRFPFAMQVERTANGMRLVAC